MRRKLLFEDDIFNLADIALEVARVDGDRIAVIEPDGFESKRSAGGKRRYKRFTYRQLSADVEAIAPGLREIGISEGTRIVCMTPPSYETAVIGLALHRVGATTVWIDPSVGYRNVGQRLRSIEPEAFVGVPLSHLGRMAFGWGPRFLRRAIAIGSGWGFPGAHSLDSLRRQAPPFPPKPAVKRDDPAIILFTTGSTGPAKPALYPHRNMAALCRVVHESWGFEPAGAVQPPVDISLFPAFFFIPLSAGGTLVVPPINFARESPATADPKAILEVINDCHVQSCFGSPVLLENIARYAIEHEVKTPSLRRVIGGGAPITARVKEALLTLVGPEGNVFANYGATEAMPSTAMDARETLNDTWSKTLAGDGLCVGRPLAGVELKIIRMSDRSIATLAKAEELPCGEIGEILVKSPHVSPRYFRDDASTMVNKIIGPNRAIWHRFGDAGRLDEQGRLWYCGRVSQRVEAAGGPLFPLNCEPIFDAHPCVRRSALVGVASSSSSGEAIPVLCVELHADTPTADTHDAIRNDLLVLASSHRATRQIEVVLFPKTIPVDPRHNSKIERPALARWATSQLAKLAAAGKT
jgi:olefin beta-lactone synthetase